MRSIMLSSRQARDAKIWELGRYSVYRQPLLYSALDSIFRENVVTSVFPAANSIKERTIDIVLLL